MYTFGSKDANSREQNLHLCQSPTKTRLLPGVRCNHKSFKSGQGAAEPMGIGKNPVLDFAGFCVVLKAGMQKLWHREVWALGH